MAEETKPAPTADRRTVLRGTALGVAVAGVGATAAACSSSNSMPQASSAQTVAAPSTPTTLTTTSQVPVGSGFIDGNVSVVVTQPSAGEFKAFTSICTHAGCQVGSVADNVIQCPCHGSQYSAKDGSVITGPATQPLAAKTITVSGGNIILEP